MAVKVISDLHSAAEEMAREVTADDALLLLGDLVNIVDYREMSGILVSLYGQDIVRQIVDLRAQGRPDAARALMASAREGQEERFSAEFSAFLRLEYTKVFEAIACPTFLIFGNVDHPTLIDELKTPLVTQADGMVVELQGLSVGFVAGGLPTPLKVPGEVPEETYNSRLFGLGKVDVVCSHIPPMIPELTYDTLARRHERGSPALLDYIKTHEPRLVLFGHVHHPFASSMSLGPSRLINCGYFRRTKRAFELAA